MLQLLPAQREASYVCLAYLTSSCRFVKEAHPVTPGGSQEGAAESCTLHFLSGRALQPMDLLCCFVVFCVKCNNTHINKNTVRALRLDSWELIAPPHYLGNRAPSLVQLLIAGVASSLIGRAGVALSLIGGAGAEVFLLW